MPANPEISNNDSLIVTNNIPSNRSLTISTRINNNNNNSMNNTSSSLTSSNSTNNITSITNTTNTTTNPAVIKKTNERNNTEKMLNALLERLDDKSLNYLRVKLNNPISHIVYIIYYYIYIYFIIIIRKKKIEVI